MPDVVSFLEPVCIDGVHSHRFDGCIFSHLNHEGGLEAVYIHMGWITVSIYSSVLGLLNSPALCHNIIPKELGHLDIPQSITLVHDLDDTLSRLNEQNWQVCWSSLYYVCV